MFTVEKLTIGRKGYGCLSDKNGFIYCQTKWVSCISIGKGPDLVLNETCHACYPTKCVEALSYEDT